MEKKKNEVKKKTASKTDKVDKKVTEVTKKEKNIDKSKSKKVNKIQFETTEQAEVKKFFIVIIVVLLCVGGIYLFTRAFVSKDLFKKDEPVTEEIQDGAFNDEVAIMGQIFNRPYEDYYVIIYDQTEGKNVGDMSNIVYNYSQKEDEKKLHMYSVDLSNELNKSYYDKDNENTSAKTLKDMKVGDNTLLRIKKNKKTGNLEVSKYITDIDAMKKELGIEETDK